MGTGTLLEKYNYLLLFFKTEFVSLNLCSKFFSPGAGTGTLAGQSWTGFTTLWIVPILIPNLCAVLILPRFLSFTGCMHAVLYIEQCVQLTELINSQSFIMIIIHRS